MTIILILVFACISLTIASPYPPQVKIVGGNGTTIEKRPYQVSLQYIINSKPQHSCGASIISTKYLLSAAHCNPGADLWLFYARIGSTEYNAGGQLLKVASYIDHPSYSRPTIDYDFAIVGFEDGVEILLGPTVQIIPLPSSTDPEDDSLLTVSGWGVMSENDIFGPISLREVDLPVFNHAKCKEIYSYVTDRQMCLGGTAQGGTSACFGDSGGPCVQNGVQYALVSGGRSCSLPNIPGLYARISSAREWIKSVTGV